MRISHKTIHMELINAFPHNLDERVSDNKRNQIKSLSLLKGHDTEEGKHSSCSHASEKSLGGEGFLVTQGANHPMEPDY